jgi:putative hemolysin
MGLQAAPAFCEFTAHMSANAENLPQGHETFSYAAPDDPWLKRVLIHLVERLTGQPYLKWQYLDYRAHPDPGSFWAAAVRRLELKIECNEEVLATWPRTGPFVIVANHPFGVLDGLVVSYLTEKVRDDFKVLTNAVLYRAEEIRKNLIPIDFTETEEALNTNLRSRAEAKLHLMHGGCLVVFPAGGASTVPKVWHKRATDAEWKMFVGRLIAQARAPVAPVYFAGQNSRLFQIASHLSMTFRLSLFFKEVYNKIGATLPVRVGPPIPFEELAKFDRKVLMDRLRDVTYALGKDMPYAPLRGGRRRRIPKGTKANP